MQMRKTKVDRMYRCNGCTEEPGETDEPEFCVMGSTGNELFPPEKCPYGLLDKYVKWEPCDLVWVKTALPTTRAEA